MGRQGEGGAGREGSVIGHPIRVVGLVGKGRGQSQLLHVRDHKGQGLQVVTRAPGLLPGRRRGRGEAGQGMRGQGRREAGGQQVRRTEQQVDALRTGVQVLR